MCNSFPVQRAGLRNRINIDSLTIKLLRSVLCSQSLKPEMESTVLLLSRVSRLMTVSHDQDNYSLFCAIDLANYLGMCSDIRWESLICSVDVTFTAIAGEPVHEM